MTTAWSSGEATAPDEIPTRSCGRKTGMVVWEARRLRQRAQAVSDKGIVGSSGRRPGGYHGFVWTRHTGMIDIRTEG